MGNKSSTEAESKGANSVLTWMKGSDFRVTSMKINPECPDMLLMIKEFNSLSLQVQQPEIDKLFRRVTYLPQSVLPVSFESQSEVANICSPTFKKLSFNFMTGSYSLKDLVLNGVACPPNETRFDSLFTFLVGEGQAMETIYEYFPYLSLDHIFVLQDGRFVITHPYLGQQYVQTVAKVTKVSY
jgi:hypothetical protein